MLLREFVYFNEKDAEQQNDNRYLSDEDKSILSPADTRKTRLTLRMLNDLRRAGEARERETKENLIVVRQMYAMPTEEQAPV